MNVRFTFRFGALLSMLIGAMMRAFAADVPAAEIVTEPKAVYGMGSVDTAAVSGDGRHLATAGMAGIFVWDFGTGTNRLWLRDHQARVSVLAFSPDSRVLLSAGRDNFIRAWDPGTGVMLRAFGPLPIEVSGLEFSPDGARFLSFGFDSRVRVWELATGELLQTLEFPGSLLNAAVFTPDGGHVVVAEGIEPFWVRRWDLSSQTPVTVYQGHTGAVRALGWLPDGRLLSGGDDETVRVWETTTGGLSRTLAGQSGGLRFVGPTGDGAVVGGGYSGRIVTWNVADGTVLHDFQDFPLIAGLVFPHEPHVLTVHSDETVRLRDSRTGASVRQFVGHTTSTTLAVAYSPDESRLLSSGTEAAVRLWDRMSRQPVRNFEGHGSGSSLAKFTPDGTRVLMARGFPQPAALLWDVETGELKQLFIGHTGWIFTAAFTTNGQRLATGSGGTEFLVRIWDVATGAPLRSLAGHQSWIRSVSFSPDATLVASGGDDLAVRVWNPETGQSVKVLEGHQAGVRTVAFSPDGRELLTLSEDGEVRFWDVASWQVNRTLRVPGGFVSSADWSPDGRLLVTGEGWPFFAARLWEARTGEMLRVFGGNTAPVDSVAFGPRGLSVLTGSEVVKLWSVADLAAGLVIRPQGDALKVQWSLGTLQRAPGIDGPWETLAASSPWLAPAEGSAGFFRVQVPEP